MDLHVTLHPDGTVTGRWAYDLKPPDIAHPGQQQIGDEEAKDASDDD